MDSQLAGLIIGPVFVALGLTVILLVGERATLQCQRLSRKQVDCTLASAKVLGTKTRSFTQLQGADVNRYRDSEGDSTYEVVLLTPEENIALTRSPSAGARGKRKIAAHINKFLEDPSQQTFRVVQNNHVLPVGLGVLFAILGIALLFHSLLS